MLIVVKQLIVLKVCLLPVLENLGNKTTSYTETEQEEIDNISAYGVSNFELVKLPFGLLLLGLFLF